VNVRSVLIEAVEAEGFGGVGVVAPVYLVLGGGGASNVRYNIFRGVLSNPCPSNGSQ